MKQKMKEQTFSNGTCRHRRHFPFRLVRLSADHKPCRHPCAARARKGRRSEAWRATSLSYRQFPSFLAPLFQNELKCFFHLHENETACRLHFHLKGFALRFVLKQRHKRTRKWPTKKHCITVKGKLRERSVRYIYIYIYIY